MKKTLAILLALVMALTLMPAVALAADDKGAIEAITPTGTVEGDNITISDATLDYCTKYHDIEQSEQESWWAGAKITAPSSVTEENVSKVKYSVTDTRNLSSPSSISNQSFASSQSVKTKDGSYYMECWMEFIYGDKPGVPQAWEYSFDWDGDGTDDQTFKITIDPCKNITLKKDNGVWFEVDDGVSTIYEGKGIIGSIEPITEGGTVNEKIKTLTFDGFTLEWYPENASIGRWQDGWWVGFKIIAPECVTDDNVKDVKYSNDGTGNLTKDFGANNDGKTDDGRYYMQCWVPVSPEYLTGAMDNGSPSLHWRYQFKWSDRSTEIFDVYVDVDNVTLKATSADAKAANIATNDDGINFQTENGRIVAEGGNEIMTNYEKADLTAVPAALADKFDTVDAIEDAMVAQVTAEVGEGYTKDNTVFYDVKLKVSKDGGTTWLDVESGEEYFPKEGITIVLPYPEGTSKETHEFVVTHIPTWGYNLGEAEIPAYKQLDDGIQVTLNSFSPVGISFKLLSAPTPVTPTPASPSSSGSNISIKYLGGNDFSTSKSATPTSVEIDGVSVPFTGNGSRFTVSSLSPNARWITVRWGSTSVTVNFTPDGQSYSNVVIPKTGDMPIWRSILNWLGLL